jgi:hypothetical protein
VRRLRWWEVRRRRELSTLFEDALRGVLYVGGDLIERTVVLVSHDLAATLGWSAERAEGVVRAEAEGKARVDCWDEDVESAFPLAVAEDTQQLLHDTFEHTTWPACPAHHRHPLWLIAEKAGLPTWHCPADDTGYGQLGELTTGGAQ